MIELGTLNQLGRRFNVSKNKDILTGEVVEVEQNENWQREWGTDKSDDWDGRGWMKVVPTTTIDEFHF